MANVIDPKTLKDRDLLAYYLHDCPDEELSSVVKMLSYAISDDAKLYSILEKVANGARLFVVYPGENRVQPSHTEVLCDVTDGFICMAKN